MILGPNHIALSVPDLERALAFYRDVLGFKEVFRYGWEPGTEMGNAADDILAVKGTGARAVHLDAGNLLIELFQFEGGNPKPQDPRRPVVDHGFTHLCFAVTDLDAEYERLRAAGVAFHCAPTPVAPGVRTVYGRDPFGNVLEFEEAEGRTLASRPPIEGQ